MQTEIEVTAAAGQCGKAHGYKVGECLACRIAELERDLAMANDAAAKGEMARMEAAGMEMRIAELEKALRQIYTGAAEESDGLSYEEIAEIADKALSL